MINSNEVIRHPFFELISLSNWNDSISYLKVKKESELNPGLKSVEISDLLLSKKQLDNKRK